MGRCFKKSIVWEFFNKNYEDNKVISVQCIKCNAIIKFYGNTTNLKDHLKKKHPIQLSEAEGQQNPMENTDSAELLDSGLCKEKTSTSTISKRTIETENVSAPPAKKFKQMRLYGASQKSGPSKDECHEFEKDLVYMIAVDC